MVSSVSNFSRSGVSDWVVQRVSAVVLALYTLLLVGFFLATPDVTFSNWHGLFSQTWMKIVSLASLIALCAHAWVGMWTISTDYLKAALVRFIFQVVSAGFIFAYLVWGIDILWSV